MSTNIPDEEFKKIVVSELHEISLALWEANKTLKQLLTETRRLVKKIKKE